MQVLGILAKHPVPGGVKTRLAETIGAERAAALAAAFLADLLDRFEHTADRRLLAFTPDTPEATGYFERRAADRYDLWVQPSGSLGERLAAFFADQGRPGRQVVAIGADSPTLDRSIVRQAFEALRDHDVVLGPATDGGYYLVGLSANCPGLFEGIPWGTSGVYEATLERVNHAGRTLEVLPPCYDIDDAEDLARLSRACATLKPVTPRWFPARTAALLREDAAGASGT